jgi:DNA-binding Lrp family transcriptional regulator
MMTAEERALMIEEMIERGEVYDGYKDHEKVQATKENRHHCTKERFMSVYSPEVSWKIMAQKLGMSESTCINFGKRYLADQGYKKRLIFRKVLDEQIVVAFKGYPSKKLISIARELNMHPSSLIPRARKLGLMP